jgi:hypothetical protein
VLVALLVDPERGGRLIDVIVQHDGVTAIERVRHRGFRRDPLQPMLAEGQFPEERRRHGHRMHRGTHIVNEPRQGHLGRAQPSADGVARLQDNRREPPARRDGCRGKPVGARTDDDDIVG